MHKLLLTAALMAAIGASPASARLQIAFSDGVTTATCADGQACDLAGAAHDLLTLNTTVGDFTVSGTFSFSVSGGHNDLSLSSFEVVNNGASAGVLRMVVSDTDFTAPVAEIRESGSLTFNHNSDAEPSTLAFWADAANGQGAGDPIATPGVLLFSASGSAATDPDSFSGTRSDPFTASALFSMTEGAALALAAGASVTGFNQDMQTSIPETSTWAMLMLGFCLLGWVSMREHSRMA